MARYIFQGTFRDGQGNIVSGGTITVYLAGTDTTATIYEDDTTVTSTSYVESDDNGYFVFYIDSSDYSASQFFDIQLAKSGYTTKLYPSISIVPLWPTDETIEVTDNTTNDVSASAHGWTPKLSDSASDFLDGKGNWDAVSDADLEVTDVTTNNASTSAHGFLKKLDNEATHFMDGTGAWDTVKDSDLALTDITDNDVSTTKHGFVPKLPDDSAQFLNGTGNWTTPSVVGAGVFRNLQASANGTDANISVSADEIVVGTADGAYTTLRNVSVTIDSSTTGANGLDTGSFAASTWYSKWVIYNPTTETVAGLLSLSATAPTLPSGYTHKARVGWIRTDSSGNKYPLSYKQYGRRVQYVVASGGNLTALPIMISGVQGSTSAPTWVSAAVGNFVPSTAFSIKILHSGVGNAAGSIVAPNNSYGPKGCATNPPWFGAHWATATYGGIYSLTYDMVLESSNIYFASDGSTNKLQCAGWEDNL